MKHRAPSAPLSGIPALQPSGPEALFTIMRPGIWRTAGPPVYGLQDKGVSPGGCMDRFSYYSGNLLLQNPSSHPALEMILPPQLKFNSAAYFVLTGSAHSPVTLTDTDGEKEIAHARVYFAPQGSVLSFGEKRYGFRTYLCWRKTEKNDGALPPTGRERVPFESFGWPDPQGLIRVMEGPEYFFLENPDAFTSQTWRITTDSNEMGLRLAPTRAPLSILAAEMISSPVSDGTVQITPKGPIVLLRHRQTIGGYPRIFNVVGADVDLLAQTAPGELIRFKMIPMEEALGIARRQRTDLDMLCSLPSPPSPQN